MVEDFVSPSGIGGRMKDIVVIGAGKIGATAAGLLAS